MQTRAQKPSFFLFLKAFVYGTVNTYATEIFKFNKFYDFIKSIKQVKT